MDKSKWPQVLAAVTASLGSFAGGTGIAWTSPVIPRIDPDLCLDDCDISGVTPTLSTWIGTIFLLGATLSGPLTFTLMSFFGRRTVLIMLAFPMLAGYVILTLTKSLDSVELILVGRFLTGLSCAGYNLLVPIYIGEIAESSIRGGLLSLIQIMVSCGIIFVDVLNIYGFADWTVISGLRIAIPIIYVGCMMLFTPESPVYLCNNQRLDEAKKSLIKLRGQHVNVEPELQAILRIKEEQDAIGSIGFKELFTNKLYLIPFLFGLFGMYNFQISGINVIFFYTQTIFTKAGSSIEPGLAAFLVAVTQLPPSLVAAYFVDKYGRRILLMISNVFMALSLASLGTFFYLDENQAVDCPWNSNATVTKCQPQDGFNPDLIESLGWLPLLSLVIFVIAFSLGIGPLAWALNAELYLPEAKKLSASMAFTATWLFGFLIVQFRPNIEDAISNSGTYFVFSAGCISALIVVIFLMPETKGRSPDQMREYYMKRFGIKS